MTEDSLQAPIGVFDSGVGGLTVLRALLNEMPHHHFVYLGDTARLPYGTKSAATVSRYAVRAADFLCSHGVKAIVVACNTAASVGLEAVEQHAGALPVIGVIAPGAEAACAASRSGHIAVIGTERTIREGAYEAAIRLRRPDARIIARPTPLLVALAEEGICNGPIPEAAVHHYLDELFQDHASAPDTLVLGCTHFPLLASAISAALGSRVRIVDSAEPTARATRARLAGKTEHIGQHERGAQEEHRPQGEQGRRVAYFATDSAERFARVGSRFLSTPIAADDVSVVDL